MATHHYLPFRVLMGRSVRHVTVFGEHWLALIGWHARPAWAGRPGRQLPVSETSGPKHC